MSGINKYTRQNTFSPLAYWRSSATSSGTCVFISHKREDAEQARIIARTLMELSIDAWLDLVELHCTTPATPEEHKALTESIECGMNNSSHLLALITPKTKGSWWVPFEIGTCRSSKKDLAFLVNKEVVDRPSYLTVGEVLDDQLMFFAWATRLSSHSQSTANRARYNMQTSTPLDTILNKNRVY